MEADVAPDGSCPICGLLIAVPEDLELHVNRCLDLGIGEVGGRGKRGWPEEDEDLDSVNVGEADAMLVSMVEEGLPPGALSQHSREMQENVGEQREEVVERPRLDPNAFRNESLGFNRKERIFGSGEGMARLKKDGGILFLEICNVFLTSMQSPKACAKFQKIFGGKQSQKSFVYATLEFETVMSSEKKIIQGTPISDGGSFPLGFEFIVYVNDYFGPLPITICIYYVKKQFWKSSEYLLGKFDLRLSDAFNSSKVHTSNLGPIFSIKDPVKLTENLLRFKKGLPISHGTLISKNRSRKDFLNNSSEDLDSFSSDSLPILESKGCSSRYILCKNASNANIKRFQASSSDGILRGVVSVDIKFLYSGFTEIFLRSESRNPHWVHPLHVSIFDNKLSLVESLFEHGSRHRLPILEGRRTCTYISALIGDVESLRTFVECDSAEVTISDLHGRLPIHCVCIGHKYRVSLALYEKDNGFTKDVSTDNLQSELVVKMCEENSIHMIELLLNAGTSLEVADNFGMSLLLLSSELGHVFLVRYCLKKGASFNQRDKNGKTSLHLATHNRKHEVMEVLLCQPGKKELLDMYDDEGRHCLSIAAENGDLRAVQLLLQHGASQWSSPLDGQMPLHIAASKGFVDVVEVLLTALSSCAKLAETIQLRDKAGESAFVKARKGNHHLVARMIENVQQEIREDETFRKNSLGKCTSWCWEGLEEDPEYMYIESIDELSERKAKMNSLLSHPTRNMRFNEPQPKILEESAAAFGHQHEVREIASVLQGLAGVHLSVPLSTAGVLLRHFRWNTDRLIRSFESDPMGTCQQAGISMSELHPMIPVPSNHNSQKSLYCPICMENLPNSNSVGLALMCGHWFCKNCWSGYLKSQISHGPICIYATCPAPDCRLVCHEDLWHEILKDNFSDSLERYSTFLVRSYIDLHPSIKWCGSPKCNKAVLYTGTAELDVRCACGFQMCFKCGQASHSPASCEEARQWRSKCDGDGKDLNFILKTSKQCPRCGVAIHRESGCNHIRCKICTHEFCWLCLGPWSRHGDATGGFYQCNLFDPTKDSKESIPGIRGKESMGKFLHYYSRYENHEEAQLFADSKQSQIRSHLAEQKDDYLEMKMELLITALEEIIECRRVLKYSYVHVYYLQDGPQKIFFEHLQEMLEKSTEYLQELVEQPEEIAFQIDIDFEQVRNYTKLTRNFARRVVEAVGLAEIERKADIEDQEVNKTKLLNF